jgi:septal ring factor EnvC (AmiA/AmiB activator)
MNMEIKSPWAKITAPLAMITMLCGGVWATAESHSRLAAAERQIAQQEVWINQQTQRIERLEITLYEIRERLARIDENVIHLRRDARLAD